MDGVEVSSPEMTGGSDGGDDTQKRFSYQHTFTAITALELLADNSDIECLFCEHHEDLLIKKKNGMLVGIQIKTRKEGHTPLTANDEDVVNSIKKFIQHEKDFPSKFSQYVIVCSCGLFSEKRNMSNLHFISDLAKSVDDIRRMDKRLKSYLVKILDKKEVENEVSIRVAIQTLTKISPFVGAPPLDYVKMALWNGLGCIPDLCGQRLEDLKVLSDQLVMEVYHASFSSPEISTMIRAAFIDDPRSYLINQEIIKKTITKNRLDALIEDYLEISWAKLVASPEKQSSRDTAIMRIKMLAGGISQLDIETAEDQVDITQAHILEKLSKCGSEASKKEVYRKYRTFKTAIRTECQDEYDRLMAQSEDSSFGSRMLLNVRDRLKSTDITSQARSNDYLNVHLHGIVGILTEECKVWWSPQFDICEEMLR